MSQFRPITKPQLSNNKRNPVGNSVIELQADPLQDVRVSLEHQNKFASTNEHEHTNLHLCPITQMRHYDSQQEVEYQSRSDKDQGLAAPKHSPYTLSASDDAFLRQAKLP